MINIKKVAARTPEVGATVAPLNTASWNIVR